MKVDVTLLLKHVISTNCSTGSGSSLHHRDAMKTGRIPLPSPPQNPPNSGFYEFNGSY